MQGNKISNKKKVFIKVGRIIVILICFLLFLMADQIVFKIKAESIHNNIALNEPEKLNNLRAYFPFKNDVEDYAKNNSLFMGAVNIETDEASRCTGYPVGNEDNKFPSRISLNATVYNEMTVAFGFVIKKIYKNYDYKKNVKLIEYPIINANSYFDDNVSFKITYAPAHNTLYIYFAGKKMLLNDVSLSRSKYYFILMTYNPDKYKLDIFLNGIKTGGKYMPSNVVSKSIELSTHVKVKPFDEVYICDDGITKNCAEIYINELTVWSRELSTAEIQRITYDSIRTTKSDASKIIMNYMQIIFVRIALIIIILMVNPKGTWAFFGKLFLSIRVFIRRNWEGAINTRDRRDWEDLAVNLGINSSGMGEHELLISILDKHFSGENHVNCSFDYVKGRVDQIVKSEEFGC